MAREQRPYEIGDRIRFEDNDNAEGEVVGFPAVVDNKELWPVRLDKGFYSEDKTFFITMVLVARGSGKII